MEHGVTSRQATNLGDSPEHFCVSLHHLPTMSQTAEPPSQPFCTPQSQVLHQSVEGSVRFVVAPGRVRVPDSNLHEDYRIRTNVPRVYSQPPSQYRSRSLSSPPADVEAVHLLRTLPTVSLSTGTPPTPTPPSRQLPRNQTDPSRVSHVDAHNAGMLSVRPLVQAGPRSSTNRNSSCIPRMLRTSSTHIPSGL